MGGAINTISSQLTPIPAAIRRRYTMSKHLIVVSIDAMVYEDLEYCSTLPNFQRIMKNSATVKRVKTIYPSLTHPVHATLITGNPAGVTGAINNSIFNPEAPDKGNGIWYNRVDQLKCDSILHAAKRAGLTVATSSWPMTSGGEDVIDYLVPCALEADFIGYEDDPIEAYRNLGAGDNVIPIIKEAVRLFTHKNKHPEVEEFQAFCCAEIIRQFKPNLVLTHPSYVDNLRHVYGVFSDEVKKSLYETDRWLGMLLDAIRDAGIENDTDLVILSDHGQINITRSISPNVYLKDKGYITLKDNGDVDRWDAYVKSAGASAHVYLKDPSDTEVYDGVYALLTEMAEEGIYGFERVYTKDEVSKKYALTGDFSFVLETDGYTSFGEWVERPAVRGFDISDYRFGRGTHGHEPHKGPQPTFVATGPSFKAGAEIENGSVLDHAPTLAAALGLELPEAMGRPVREILA